MPLVEEVELIQQALVEESMGVLSPITEIGNAIPEAPTLPPFLIEDIVPVVEDAEVSEPVIQEAVSVSYPSTNGGVIPEAPTLPPSSIEDIVPVDEDVEMLKQVILEETFGVIPETPTLPTIEELLPCEDFELVEPVILKEPADVWSLIAELDEIILESPTIPSSQIEPMTLVEPVSALPPTTEITEIVPDTTTLPSLPIKGIAPAVEEVEIVKPEILEDTVAGIPKTPTVTATEELMPCEEVELVESVILDESVEKIIHDAPTLSPISIENVDLLIKDILLQKPDILEELKKMFPEFDRAITEPPTLTSLLIGEIYLKEPILEEYASDPEPIILDEDIPVEEEILIDPCTGLKEPAYYMSNTSETFIIPGAPKISFSEAPCALVENTNLEYMDYHEPTIITEPVLESDKAEYFLPEQFPLINGEEVNEDVIMGDSAEMYPKRERTRLEVHKETSVVNSTALDKVSQGISYRKTVHPDYVPVPTNNQAIFNYRPIISQLSTSKPKSLNNKLVKGHPCRFRTNPYPKMKEQFEHNNKVLLPTSYDTVINRISPNRSLKKPVSEL